MSPRLPHRQAGGAGDDSERHALVVEHRLRPLFSFFAAHTLPSGIFAVDRDFTDYVPTGEPLHRRIGMTVAELGAFLPKTPVLAAERASAR